MSAEPNYVNGIDTNKYDVVLNQDGVIILQEKNSPTILTQRIKPQEATDMIASHLKPAVISRRLQKTKARCIDFRISMLVKFYQDYQAGGQAPQFLRIYFAEYDGTNAPTPNHVGKTTCILVGVKDENDVYNEGNASLWPVNIGTLCPPDCTGDGVFSEQTKGAIFLKKAAVKAGADYWDY